MLETRRGDVLELVGMTSWNCIRAALGGAMECGCLFDLLDQNRGRPEVDNFVCA